MWSGDYMREEQINKFDPALGRMRRMIEMPEWNSAGNIYDQSFAESDTRLWVLTYRHDYHVTGESKRWIHLLDVSALARLSQSADGGTLAADESSNLDVVFDARGAASEIHWASLEIDSDGGRRQSPTCSWFTLRAPTARRRRTPGLTRPSMRRRRRCR